MTTLLDSTTIDEPVAQTVSPALLGIIPLCYQVREDEIHKMPQNRAALHERII
jgi:hypothetical protein